MKLLQKFRVNNENSHRHFDANGYLFVDESPVLKAGVLEYHGQELIDGGSPEVDGIQIDPEKIYKVFLPLEELEKAASTFTLLPITNDHEWLGVEGADARDYQEGTTGENAVVKNEAIYVPLKFTGDGIVDDIKSRRKEELSASYTNKLSKSANVDYDFIATDIKGNHIALVERGRCGPDVRVLNQRMENQNMKSKNEVKLVIDGKEVDLNKFFDQEEKEDAHEGTGAITETENDEVDKRHEIDEIGGILKGKIDEELWRTVIGKVEKVAYNPSTASKTDNVDKRQEIEEVGGFLKDKGLSDEDIRYVIGKMEKDAYNPSETSKSDNEEPEDDEKSKVENSARSFDAIYSKISNALRKRESEKEKALKRAYNAASQVIGEFNPYGLSEREMLTKALNHQGIDTANESVAELYAMLKVCNAQSKVDNSFSYGSSGTDEIEINI